MRLHINPVDLSQPVTLPDPWQELERSGFHPDLMERAKAFMLKARRDKFAACAKEFLEIIGHGFRVPFASGRFRPAMGDPDYRLKTDILEALDELSSEFGNRVSSLVWDTFAFLGTRPNPRQHATILSQADILPHPYWAADTVLHGAAKVYSFMFHMQSRVCEKAGIVFNHNCDCGCDVREPGTGVVQCFMKPGEFPEATAALLSHLLCESKLIMKDKLPFELGLSPEAAEVMAIEKPRDKHATRLRRVA